VLYSIAVLDLKIVKSEKVAPHQPGAEHVIAPPDMGRGPA
jgi:hypothetical protein